MTIEIKIEVKKRKLSNDGEMAAKEMFRLGYRLYDIETGEDITDQIIPRKEQAKLLNPSQVS